MYLMTWKIKIKGDRLIVMQRVIRTFGFLSYLHDDEEDQGDEDVDLRVFPGLRVSDVVKLLSDALFGPRPVVQ